MLRFFLIGLVVIFLSATIHGQSAIGVKGGLLFSNLAVDADEIDENTTQSAFTAGIVTRTNFYAGAVGLQGEFLFSRKGAEYQIGTTTVDANLDYLELPVSVQIRLVGPLSIYAGAYGGYLLNVRYEYRSSLIGPDIVVFEDTESFNRFDYGLFGGLNIAIGPLYIDGRITRGLQSVEAEEQRIVNGIPFAGNDTRNVGLAFTLGILL